MQAPYLVILELNGRDLRIEFADGSSKCCIQCVNGALAFCGTQFNLIVYTHPDGRLRTGFPIRIALDNDPETFQFKKLRSEEHTSELQSRGHLVCRLLLEKK